MYISPVGISCSSFAVSIHSFTKLERRCCVPLPTTFSSQLRRVAGSSRSFHSRQIALYPLDRTVPASFRQVRAFPHVPASPPDRTSNSWRDFNSGGHRAGARYLIITLTEISLFNVFYWRIYFDTNYLNKVSLN